MEQPPREELEFIPWSELLERHRPVRPWMAYLVAGALAAAGLGALVARAVWTPRMVPPVVESREPVAEVEAGAGASPAPPVPGLYREADLMAVSPATGATQAALPALPQERPGPLSYVEWARAVETEPLEEGLYRVTVAFRSIAGSDGSFHRLPVRAVAVVVGVDPAGGSAVLDLPIPVSLPASPDTVSWPAEQAVPPEEVVGAALAEARAWGSDPQVVAAGPAGAAWRVVVEVGDESGRRWPLALWVGGSGSVLAPPWLGPGPP